MTMQIATHNVLSRGVRNRVAQKLAQTPGVFEMPSAVQLSIESHNDGSVNAEFVFAYLDGKERRGSSVREPNSFRIEFGQSSNRILSIFVKLPGLAAMDAVQPAEIKKRAVVAACDALERSMPRLNFTNAPRNAELIGQTLSLLPIGNDAHRE
ncbi:MULTISPECIES: hypothetical protein [Rhodopirellula]|uniref:hypothetical protein n=1 Tax=Rhodopirellula TaxID=265488 RepID=UPI0025801FCB|nr:hypothetical protein [Rhodopirellula sp. UBA1907]|tara:strand:- start:4301 stop:4759 length:459 start_codon:yes stop_codon:yes gene_type:complete